MKIAVGNLCGGSGKTTAATNLLAPRMEGARLIAVETINQTAEALGLKVEKLAGEDFRPLFNELVMADDAIVDIGASNIEDVLNGLRRYEGAHLEIDRFIVPTTQGIKEQMETMQMVTMLSEFGVDPQNIRVLFNRVKESVGKEFRQVLNFAEKKKTCVADPRAAIFESEIFSMLAVRETTIAKVLADPTDYKALARAARDNEALRIKHLNMHAIKAMAGLVSLELDQVFAIITA